MKGIIKLEECLKIAERKPCSNKLRKIICDEINSGNAIYSFENAAMFSDETYYIILFNRFSKFDYENLTTHKAKDGKLYKVMLLTDNNGAVEIRFNY